MISAGVRDLPGTFMTTAYTYMPLGSEHSLSSLKEASLICSREEVHAYYASFQSRSLVTNKVMMGYGFVDRTRGLGTHNSYPTQIFRRLFCSPGRPPSWTLALWTSVPNAIRLIRLELSTSVCFLDQAISPSYDRDRE
jgi:hypothetical protein